MFEEERVRMIELQSKERTHEGLGARRSAAAVFSLWLVAAVITISASLSVACMSFLLDYVAAESQWSKGQKDAAHALERFAGSGAEADYQAFLQGIAVPLAYRRAKFELNKAQFDPAALAGALANGNITPKDIDGMAWLYRNFKNTPLFSPALNLWDSGDQYILELHDIGHQLHALVAAGKANDPAALALAAEVQDIDLQLAPVERGFSSALEDAARGTRKALILALSASCLLLAGVFTLFIRRSFAQREQLDAQLHLSEERLGLGFEGINAGLWDFDFERDRVYYSPQLYEQLGYRVGELSLDGLGSFSLIHPDDLPLARVALRDHLTSDAVFDVEIRLRMGHGGYLWCRAHGKALRNAKGRAFRMVGCVFDVSDRKRAEASAREEKELAQITLDSIGDGVIRTDDGGRVTYCNAMAEQILGRSAIEMHAQPFESVCVLGDDARSERVAHCAGPLTPQHAFNSGATQNLYVARPDGSRLPVSYSATNMRDTKGNAIGTVVVLRDVSAERQHAATLAYQAAHDELTDLFNRREFEHRINRMLEQSTSSNLEYAVLFLDLDQFKIVNDTCGHEAGDELIRHVSATLKGCLREDDMLARLGGDEFGVVLQDCATQEALRVADCLRLAVENIHLPWFDVFLTTGVSIGVVTGATNLKSSKEIMKAADVACYVAKEKGRNRVHRFSHDDQESSAAHSQMVWASRVKATLAHDRFCLYAQKIVPLGLQQVEERRGIHVELLLRMKDETGAIVPPSHFIGAAERFNLMPAIDRWVIDRAFSIIAANAHENGTWSINLSGESVGDERIFDYITDQQQRWGISLERVCFEITETAAITNLHRVAALINRLRALGCRFALDDFGTGMSSFNYLKHLSIDYLKIDGSFVRGIENCSLDRSIVRSITQVAHEAGKLVIAEFAENQAIIECLREMGVDYAQGYGVGLPEPISASLTLPALQDI